MGHSIGSSWIYQSVIPSILRAGFYVLGREELVRSPNVPFVCIVLSGQNLVIGYKNPEIQIPTEKIISVRTIVQVSLNLYCAARETIQK